jgi:hypothetical protein
LSSQQILLHFSHDISRQFVDEMDSFRQLEFRQSIPENFEDLCFADRSACLLDHHGRDGLTEVAVRKSDHSGLHYSRNRVDFRLDLLRVSARETKSWLLIRKSSDKGFAMRAGLLPSTQGEPDLPTYGNPTDSIR